MDTLNARNLSHDYGAIILQHPVIYTCIEQCDTLLCNETAPFFRMEHTDSA